MPRALSEIRTSAPATEETSRGVKITRNTARSFAAAVSVLLIATLVVNRSSAALNGDPATASSALELGSIELTDDDQGRSLFDLADLTPARPVEQCIEVTYLGTILPVALEVRVNADGALADYLDITIDEGTGGGYESCAQFERRRSIVDGTVADVEASGWFEVGDLLNTGDSRTFRVTLLVQDDERAIGQGANLELGWEVVPS